MKDLNRFERYLVGKGKPYTKDEKGHLTILGPLTITKPYTRAQRSQSKYQPHPDDTENVKKGVSLTLTVPALTAGPIPPNTTVCGSLLIETRLGKTPKNLTVRGSMLVEGTGLSVVSEGLEVSGDLHIRGCPVQTIPDDMKLGGKLHADGCPLTNYPIVQGSWTFERPRREFFAEGLPYCPGSTRVERLPGRAICLDFNDRSVIHLPGFSGTREEAEDFTALQHRGPENRELSEEEEDFFLADLCAIESCYGKQSRIDNVKNQK